MKSLVAYFSQTGNTRKVAEAIFGELPEPKEIRELGEVESLEGCDLCFIGFPVIAFGPAQQGREFLENKADGRDVALFITHAAPEREAEEEGWLENCRQAAAGAELIGFFHCQGELAAPVMEALLKSDNEVLRAFGERGPETKGQPDETRLERARAFAREVLSRAAP